MVVPFYGSLRGRLDLGVGRGYQPYEFFGVPIKENFERFNEYMEIVTRCLSGEGLAYNGKYFRFPTTWTFPGALQKPHPPFWHAGSSPASMRLSGERGYHTICSGPMENLKSNNRTFKEALEANGWGEREFTILRHTYVSHDPEEAAAQFENGMYVRRTAGRLRAGTERVVGGRAFSDPLPDEAPMEELLETTLLLGTPDECIRKIRAFQDEAGVTTLLCQFDIGGLETERAMVSMELFAKEVMPALRAAGVGV